MITELTEKQLSRLPEFIAKWSSLGRSTASVNHPHAEERVRNAYRAAGLPEPKAFVWFESPLLGAIAYLTLKKLDELGGSGRVMFGTSLGLSVEPPRIAGLERLTPDVGKEVLSILTKELADIIYDRVYIRVDANIIEDIVNSLAPAINGSEWNRMREHLEAVAGMEKLPWEELRLKILTDLPRLSTMIFRNGLGEKTAADWRCLCDYLFNVCGVASCEPPNYLDLNSPPLWWWPFESICLMSERYHEIKLDDDFRLHSERGPAVRYRDGWEVYCWHGTVVPSWVFTEPHRITAQTIIDGASPAIRFVMLARYGEDRFVNDSGVPLLPLGRYPGWPQLRQPAPSRESWFLYRTLLQIWRTLFVYLGAGGPDWAALVACFSSTLNSSLTASAGQTKQMARIACPDRRTLC